MFYNLLKKRINLINAIDSQLDKTFESCIPTVIKSIKNGGCLFFAGNGGSAAEAQHMSAEYIATLDHKNFRPGIKSIALTTDTSLLTAWTNDFGFKEVFSRQLETLGKDKDIFFAYSTSGNSENIIKALEVAKKIGITTIGFSGNDGGLMKELCDECFIIPSQNTALIQEIHTMIGHELCANIEKEIFFK